MAARQLVLLTSPDSSHPFQLLSRQQSAPVNPSEATLMILPASVANKRLTLRLSPLNATLTKNPGAHPSSQILLARPATLSQPPIFRTLFQVPYPATPLFATLTKKTGVWGHSSHSGTPPTHPVPIVSTNCSTLVLRVRPNDSAGHVRRFPLCLLSRVTDREPRNTSFQVLRKRSVGSRSLNERQGNLGGAGGPAGEVRALERSGAWQLPGAAVQEEMGLVG